MDGSLLVAVVVLLPVVAWILLLAPRDMRDWPASKEEALAGWGVRWPECPADRAPAGRRTDPRLVRADHPWT